CEPRVSNAETVTEEIQTQKEVKAAILVVQQVWGHKQFPLVKCWIC
ncbi:hypothetical protein TNCT_691111, partial [Trichonephila clavata]